MNSLKKRVRFSILVWVITLLFSSTVLAQGDPKAFMKGITDNVMNALKSHRAELKKNPGRVYSLIDSYIIPYADFAEMGRWVVGRNAWQAASDGSKQEFIKEFRTLVVRTYGSALLGYSDQTVEFLPTRSSGGERVQVSSLIKQSGKKPLRLDYRLIREGGSWKMYDIVIEGISIVQGYRAQFANDAKAGGLPAVIGKIKAHNRGR